MLKHYRRVLPLLAAIGGALAAASLGTGRYAVILTDPSVAKHAAALGGTRGAAAANYRGQVVASQATLRQQLEKRNLRVTGAAQTLLNAVFVAASNDEAAQLRALPGVKAVAPLHRYRMLLDQAVQLTNVPAAWSQLGGTANAGAGVKIAILDNGIDQTHPAFQDASLQRPAGYPICDVQQNWKCADFTNNKVIVARSYVPTLAAGTQPNPAADSRPDDPSPRDRMGHGTALAMIAAGMTNAGPLATITGVAPKAFLGNYKVFGTPGVNDFTYGDIIIQALEDALSDGMDIAVLSLGGPALSGPLDEATACVDATGSDFCDPEAAAVEAAVQSGMSVVVAAGNDGGSGLNTPTLNSISSPATAPSAIAAGASTNSHTLVLTVQVQGANVPQNLQSIAAEYGDGPERMAPLTAPLRDVSTLDGTGYACSPLPAGSLDGTIALIVRSVCSFAAKVLNAQEAGAVGVILIQQSGEGAAISPGGLYGTLTPTVMIGDTVGQSLRSYLASNPGSTATINPALPSVSAYNEVAWFSSHGPSIDLRLKPELVAVGTDMYMAAQRFDPNGVMYDPSGYTVAGGTSFSTPMIAGALALVKQAHPEFTTWQLKSAVVNTATQDVTENGGSASVVSAGNGKLSVGDALQAAVTVNPATISFGALTSGITPTPQKLTLHYSGTSAATLTLAAVAVNGNPPSLDKTILTVAPGQADPTVTLTLPSSVPSTGIYEGRIVIQGAGATVRVPYLYVVGDGNPNDLLALGDGFDGTVGQMIPTGGFALKLIDSSGVPVAGWPVSFGVVSGGGTVFNAEQADQCGRRRRGRCDTRPLGRNSGVLGPHLRLRVFVLLRNGANRCPPLPR